MRSMDSNLPETVVDMQHYLASEYPHLTDPGYSSGMCYEVSEFLAAYFDEFIPVHAEHDNDPIGRFEEMGQYSNHFALYHVKDQMVVDFTFRQFDPDSPFPLVTTRRNWHNRLRRAWGVTQLARTTKNDWTPDY